MLYSSPPGRIALANIPTPLQPLDRLSSHFKGPRLWIKRDDLTGTTLTGNKVRKLEFVVQRALDQGADTLLTRGGLQSNQCRATAIVAAQLGLACHLVLRGEPPAVNDGNAFLAELSGAKMSFMGPAEYGREAQRTLLNLQHLYQAQGRSAYVIPTGASDGVGLWGYYTAAAELLEDFSGHDIDPAFVCCATGSGGTHAGLALGFAHLKAAPVVRGYAVCDSQAYFQSKSAKDIRDWYALYCPEEQQPVIPALDINDAYIGAGYGKADESVYRAIKLLARTEGIILDPVYTGKAFAALLDQLTRGEFEGASDIVFMHTGGLFGLFPYREHFDAGMRSEV